MLLSNADFDELIVREAATMMRRERRHVAMLLRFEDDACIVRAAHGTPAVADGTAFSNAVPFLERLRASDGEVIEAPGADAPFVCGGVAGRLLAPRSAVFPGDATAIVVAAEAPRTLRFDEHDRAYVDALAALYCARLSERVARADAHGEFRSRARRAVRKGAVAVAVLDLDRFHDVNALHGRRVGDALLDAVGSALNARARGDFVARLGGDRFGMLLSDADDEADLQERIARHAALFARPFVVMVEDGEERIDLGASIGVAYAVARGVDLDELMHRADEALYACKHIDGAPWAFFESGETAQLLQKRGLERDLERALRNDELRLYYQPEIDMASGAVVGAEALLRWRHRGRILCAGDFVGIAEQMKILSTIDDWVFRRAAAAAARVYASDEQFRMWINVSADDLCNAKLLRRLDNAPRARLGIEVTETALMRDVPAAIRTLREVRDAGIPIALDDFGTGYSSLAQLKRLPIDVVKLDRSFTAGVPHDTHDCHLIDAVIALGRHFGFTVIAEGIERAEQADWLREHGCTVGQGFLYGRAVSERRLMHVLRHH